MDLSDQENQEQELSSTEDEDDGHHSNPLIPPPKVTGRRRSKGEKLGSDGGRPTGKKDRHSKVNTAKGPRDRRVRLSAHTAIQFYDVQDRLGCDRPNEAIEWLMKKARSAIEALDESPSPPPARTAAGAEQEYFDHQGGFLGCGYESQKRLSEDPSDGFSFIVENNNHLPNEFDSVCRSQNHQSFCLLLQSESSGFCSPQGSEMCQEELFSQGGTLQSSFYVPSMEQMPAQCSSSVAGNYTPGDWFSGFFRGENHNAVPNKCPRTNW